MRKKFDFFMMGKKCFRCLEFDSHIQEMWSSVGISLFRFRVLEEGFGEAENRWCAKVICMGHRCYRPESRILSIDRERGPWSHLHQG